MANGEIWRAPEDRAHLEPERVRVKMDSRDKETLVDVVNSPPHYTRLHPQPIDIIESWGLGFHAAQVLKYIARAGHKDRKKFVEDLEKARFYLNRWIERLKSEL